MVWLKGRTRPPYKEQREWTHSVPTSFTGLPSSNWMKVARAPIDEAQEIMAGYVLQIDVGVGVSESETRQAMLLTAVNTAVRAFLGGVRVCRS